jgi:hypothetical protein
LGEITRRIALEDSELEDWRRAVETIATGFDLKFGLIEQFAGFFSLSEIDLTEYASRTTPINVVLGWERTQSSQVIKHADKAGIIFESGDSSQPLNPEASISNPILPYSVMRESICGAILLELMSLQFTRRDDLQCVGRDKLCIDHAKPPY